MIIDKKLLYVDNKRDYNHESSDTNIFRYSLKALIESNDIIIKKLQEEAYITEGLFGGGGEKKVFNFFGVIDAIIGAFINIIEKIVGKFLMILVTLAGQGRAFDLEARAFAKKIENYRGGFKLNNIYVFSNLEPGAFPDAGLADYFSDSLNTFIEGFNNAIGSSATASVVNDRIEAVNVPLQEKLNQFRCHILDIKDNSEIMSDEIFGNECFKKFRSDSETPKTEYFNGYQVYKDYYLPYIENKKLQAETRKESKMVQNACKEAKNKLKKFTPDFSKFKDEDYASVVNMYNNVQRNVCTLFDYECKDVVTLYGAKLQAYKDSYVQSRRVIMKCMQEIAENAPFANKEKGEW